MFDSSSMRSLAVVDFSSTKLPINIIGCGAVGSRIAEQLVCLGVNLLNVYDFDDVEGHNLHNQLWSSAHIGMSKVDALGRWVADKTGSPVGDNINLINKRVTKEDVASMSGIVVCCVDTFDGRRMVIDGAVESGKVVSVVEGRCAPRHSEVLIINPFDSNQVEAFKNSLGNDDDPDPYVNVCGSPISFSPIMTMAALNMTLEICNIINGRIDPIDNCRKLRSIADPMVLTARMELT